MSWQIVVNGTVKATTKTKAAAIEACRRAKLTVRPGGMYERPADGVEIRKTPDLKLIEDRSAS